MIYLIHGDNQDAAYRRILEISKTNTQKHQKLSFDASRVDDFISHAVNTDLLGSDKLIIAQDLIGKNLLKPKQVKDFQNTNIVILWERKELTKTQAAAWFKVAEVETFKLPGTLFYFLDSISNSPKESLKWLNKLSARDSSTLLWQTTNRLSLLILTKIGISQQEASGFTKRPIASWQWSKILNQAGRIDLFTLKQMHQAALKLDYLIKTGKTTLGPRTLVSLLLLKYLKG